VDEEELSLSTPSSVDAVAAGMVQPVFAPGVCLAQAGSLASSDAGTCADDVLRAAMPTESAVTRDELGELSGESARIDGGTAACTLMGCVAQLSRTQAAAPPSASGFFSCDIVFRLHSPHTLRGKSWRGWVTSVLAWREKEGRSANTTMSISKLYDPGLLDQEMDPRLAEFAARRSRACLLLHPNLERI